ncbi:MAG: hypothetical protein M1433_02310 [Candidatus Parvarchaeota archaeon]|nr:hypothetical protein [Candidatus Parvarchaeota archaeon]
MTFEFILGFIIGVIVVSAVLGVVSYFLYKYSVRRAFEEWREKELSREVERSLNAQRAIVKGQISEKLFPVISKQFGNVADFRFVGDPIDYVVFQGLSDQQSVNAKVDIKFVEIKTGSSKLNVSEKLVKDAVENGRVSWEEVHL